MLPTRNSAQAKTMKPPPILVALLGVFLVGAFMFLGCQRWRGQGPGDETRIDATLASPLPASVPPVNPEKPQKGFEQESPKAQSG